MSLPILYNPQTKIVSIDEEDPAAHLFPNLKEDIDQLNRLSKDLISINSDVPESPEPSKTLTPLIQKLLTSGLDALKKKKFSDAIKQLSLAIEMAGKRARWEAFAVQLQEMNGILQIRCDAYLMNRQFVEAYNDADILLGTQVNTAENFLRRAISAMNLGRLEQAKADVERGLCYHPTNAKLQEHLVVIKRAIDIENGDFGL